MTAFWRGGTTKPSDEICFLKNNNFIQQMASGLPCTNPLQTFAKTQLFISSKKSAMEYGGCVYIITNFHNTVLYTGVTSDLHLRIWQHKTKVYKNSFTSKYNCDKLVWYETFSRIEDAISREKQIKAGNRKRKEDLIHALNPHWNDLWEDIQNW